MQTLYSLSSAASTSVFPKGSFDPFENSNLEHRMLVNGASIHVKFDPHNERVKAYGFHAASDLDPFLEKLTPLIEELEAENDVRIGKILMYVRCRQVEVEAPKRTDFDPTVPQPEARILGFFPDGAAAEIWSIWRDPARATLREERKLDEIVELAEKQEVSPMNQLSGDYACEAASAAHAEQISEVMNQVFDDYANPIDKDTIRDMIERGTHHFRVVRDKSDGELVATASAELDHKHGIAEMTDCTTLPEHRGNGLLKHLLWTLERDAQNLYGIQSAYSVARAVQPGVNIAFSKLGYQPLGRLVGNSRMPEGWESMNIWSKVLAS